MFVWSTVELEEAHQVGKLSVDVSKNLEGCLRLQDHRLVDDDLLGHVAKMNDVLCLEINIDGISIHETLWLEKLVQEIVWNVSLGSQWPFDIILRSNL